MYKTSKYFNDLSRQPAKSFEAATNINGISGNYIIPENMTSADFEDLYTWSLRGKDYTLQAPRIFETCDVPEKFSRPDSMDINDYLATVSKEFADILYQAWEKLVDCNPELVALGVKKDDAREIYDAILGVTSGFCLDDMDFYLRTQRQGERPGETSSKQSGLVLDLIERISGQPLHWAPSRKTVRKIGTHFFKGKYAPFLQLLK